MAEYRRGNPREALEHLQDAFDQFEEKTSPGTQDSSQGITQFFAAMAHAEAGDDNAARTAYLDGLDRHARSNDGRRASQTSTSTYWLMAEVVRREAKKKLGINEDDIDPTIRDTSDWTVLFEDNFDDGIGEEWQRLSGDWTVVDGAACGTLVQPDGGFEGYDQLEREFPDLPPTFEFEYETWTSAPMLAASFLRLPDDAPTPLGFRVALVSLPDRHLVNQGRPGTGVSLQTSADIGWWISQSVPDFKVEPGRHYKVRIIRQPQRITVFIDGKEVLSERVRNIETRSIRFFARGEEGTKMYVDNVKVRGPQKTDTDNATKAEVDPVN